MRIKPIKQFFTALTPPPDKSITIRALIMGLLANGTTYVYNPLVSGDTVSALGAVSALGGEVDFRGGVITVKGGHPLLDCTVDAGNSATALRLLMGVVAGQNASVKFTGDSSLCGRSHKAVVDALTAMGADISGAKAPLTVRGKQLSGIDFVPSAPSAQVKSAVLLAGLNASSPTTVTEKIKTRPHTEEMLSRFGADIEVSGNTVRLNPSKLSAAEITVPGDISSAAYPMVLALKKGYCYLKNVGNSRRELIDFLVSIGGEIEEEKGQYSSNLTVKQSNLRPFTVSGALATALIDELPLLAVLAATIEGESVIRDGGALRNKECDRIRQTVLNLKNLGVDITENPDGFAVRGGTINGGSVITKGDHRIAMSMAVALALSAKGGTIDDDKCVEISYPSFWELLQ